MPTSRTARKRDQDEAAAAGPKPPDEPPPQELLEAEAKQQWDFSNHNTWTDQEITNWNAMLKEQDKPPIKRDPNWVVRPKTMPPKKSAAGQKDDKDKDKDLDAAPRAPQAKRQPQVRKTTRVLPAVIGVKEEEVTDDEMGAQHEEILRARHNPFDGFRT